MTNDHRISKDRHVRIAAAEADEAAGRDLARARKGEDWTIRQAGQFPGGK